MAVVDRLQYFAPMNVPNVGWVTRFADHSTGRMVSGNDTFGAYWRDATDTSWQLLTTTAIFGTGFVRGDGTDANFGCYDIAIAPNDANRVYLIFNSRFFKLVYSSGAWLATEGASATLNGGTWDMSSNPNDIKHPQKRIAIDPRNKDHVIVGTETRGAYESFDGGTTFTSLTAAGFPLPHASSSSSGGRRPGATCFMFDASSAALGSGDTSIVYGFSQGNGCYRRTTAGTGGAWTLLTGLPANNTKVGFDIDIDPSGNVYLCYADNYTITVGDVYKATNSGNFTLLRHTTFPIMGISINPADPTHLIAKGGYTATGCHSISESTNSGTAWTDTTTDTRTASTEPAMNTAYAKNSGAAVTGGRFLKSATNKYMVYDGFGLWSITRTPANIGTAVSYTSESVGLQQLVMRDIVNTPDGDVLTAWWDQFSGVVRTANGSRSARTALPSFVDYTNTVTITDGMNVHVQTGNVNRIGISAGRNVPGGTRKSGIYNKSTGVFTQIPAHALYTRLPNTGFANGGFGGEYAEGGDIIPYGTNGAMVIPRIGTPSYCDDLTAGSPTVVAMSFPGSTNQVVSGSGTVPDPYVIDGNGYGNFYVNYYTEPKRRVFCSDAVTAGTHYAVHRNLGHYKTTDNGHSWTRVRNTPIEANVNFNMKIRGIPFVAGGVMFCAGGTSPPVSSERLWYSTDGGATWSAIGVSDGVREVVTFGFGAPGEGQTIPSLLFFGIVGAEYGHFICYNWTSASPTFYRIAADYAGGSLDHTSAISGDMKHRDHVYLGKQGSGMWWSHGGPVGYPSHLSWGV